MKVLWHRWRNASGMFYMLGIYALSSSAFGCYINHMAEISLFLSPALPTYFCATMFGSTWRFSIKTHRKQLRQSSALCFRPIASVFICCSEMCSWDVRMLRSIWLRSSLIPIKAKLQNAWWYNGFCKYLPLLDTEWFSRYGKGDKILMSCELYNHRCLFTAGLVVMMSLSCRPITVRSWWA